MISEQEMDNPNPLSNPPQTLGQRRVRAAFNPSQNSLVDEIKMKSAELIDMCELLKGSKVSDKGELIRLCSLAQTHYEDAAMWAVKAATA